MTPAARVCIEEGRRLRRLGLSPIPIVRSIGFCPVRYSGYRDGGMPADVYEKIVLEHGAHGIQCFTGWDKDLAIVDLDGAEAQDRWSYDCDVYGCPPTVSGATPRQGLQLWFVLPYGCQRIPSCHLWKGPEGEHEGIEILGDRAMARCAPSHKILGGRAVRYAWLPGMAPGEHPFATLPDWVIERAEEICPPRKVFSASRSPQITQTTFHVKSSRYPDWRDVRDGVDRLRKAKEWGLRTVGHEQPNADGWIACRAIDREDRHPSARFCPATGAYYDAARKELLNFFALAQRLGGYPDYLSAKDALAVEAGLLVERSA